MNSSPSTNWGISEDKGHSLPEPMSQESLCWHWKPPFYKGRNTERKQLCGLPDCLTSMALTSTHVMPIIIMAWEYKTNILCPPPPPISHSDTHIRCSFSYRQIIASIVNTISLFSVITSVHLISLLAVVLKVLISIDFAVPLVVCLVFFTR